MGSDAVQPHVRPASAWGLRPCRVVLFCLCLLAGAVGVQAQSFFLTLTNTPDPILLGNHITYNLSVSNATGQNLSPETGIIESRFFESAEVIRVTNSQGGFTTNLPGLVLFTNLTFAIGTVVNIEVVLRPTTGGLLTNTFTVSEANTAPEFTNAVSEVVLPEVDLGVFIVGPTDGVFPGDAFSYHLLATNAGPETAPAVVVSNLFPDNVSLVGLSPAGSVELIDGYVLFSAGALTNHAATGATVSVRATNAVATNWITATISAPNVSDTNTVNNSSTSNIPILTPVFGQIIEIETDRSAQQLNPQTGWLEQRVVLENVGPTNVDSVRLLVDGLTNGLELVNVTDTNGTTPYVAYGDTLSAGEQIELLLEYFSPSRTPGVDPLFTAYGTPQLDLTPAKGTEVAVSRIVQISHTNLNQGRVLLEWPVTTGMSFQVVYDEQVDFASAKGSLPRVTVPAGANRVQWLDYGPPRTLTAPSNTTARFYKVIELP